MSASWMAGRRGEKFFAPTQSWRCDDNCLPNVAVFNEWNGLNDLNVLNPEELSDP
jgi:hypothetical protein